MTHRESIKEIRKQMARALAEGKIGVYVDLLTQLSTMQLDEASKVDHEETMARMTDAYRGGW